MAARAAFSTPIISGLYKGRRVALPDSDSVRPTKNRVRQAVFNLLGSRVDVRGLRVADLCCGSAALGLEAASRGAVEVCCVDMDVRLADGNVAALGASMVRVAKGDVLGFVPPAPFEVLLIDPPYASGIAQKLLGRRAVLGTPGSWWVVETDATAELDTTGFEVDATRDYGQTRLWVLRQM